MVLAYPKPNHCRQPTDFKQCRKYVAGPNQHTLSVDIPSAPVLLLAAVMLLDIGMRGMDGYKVARRTRAAQQVEKLPLIALTGWGQEEDRRRTAEAGFDHHLVKPVDLDLLRSLLASISDS